MAKQYSASGKAEKQRKIVAGVLLVVFFLLTLYSMRPMNTNNDSSEPEQNTQQEIPPTTIDRPEAATKQPAVDVGPKRAFGDGQFIVGEDVQAGTYVVDTVSGCYYERQANFNGDIDSIISNELVSVYTAQFVVTILPTDKVSCLEIVAAGIQKQILKKKPIYTNLYLTACSLSVPRSNLERTEVNQLAILVTGSAWQILRVEYTALLLMDLTVA